MQKSHSLGHPRANALLLDVPGSGLHPDGHGYLETTKFNLFCHTQQLLFQQNYQNSHSLGHTGVNALLLGVRGSGPHPDGHGRPKTTGNNYFYHTQQLLSQQNCLKVIPCDALGSIPHFWLSEAMALTQMVMDICK